jgi:hypothetical protein
MSILWALSGNLWANSLRMLGFMKATCIWIGEGDKPPMCVWGMEVMPPMGSRAINIITVIL